MIRLKAELSGVPRTSVYQVMEALTEQGLAEAVPTFGPAIWTVPGKAEHPRRALRSPW